MFLTRLLAYSRRSNHGQFAPMVAMVIFASILFLYAVMNVYRVSRAKLQAQNLADATALAIASLEAKSINTVVDRNEWLNHMYPEGYKSGDKSIPTLSQLAGGAPGNALGMSKKTSMKDEEAEAYAKLIYSINVAQYMFMDAYDGFMGADRNKVQSMNSGISSLAEILSEISDLRDDPDIQVFVYNTEDGKNKAESAAKKPNLSNPNASMLDRLQVMEMKPINFKTESVSVWADKNKKAPTPLRDLLPNNTKKVDIGYVRPDWQSTDTTYAGFNEGSERRIGAGAVIIKRVRVAGLKDVYVKASAMAYVVKESGWSYASNNFGQGKAPTSFKPTYYVKLAGGQ